MVDTDDTYHDRWTYKSESDQYKFHVEYCGRKTQYFLYEVLSFDISL